MDYSKVLTNYRRFRESSAIKNEERNLIEDYAATVRWLEKNIDTESSYGQYLLLCLKGDAQYLTVFATIRRGLRFKDMAGIGEWDGETVKNLCELVTKVVDTYNVGDMDAWRVQKSRLIGAVMSLNDTPAMQLYVIQRWMQFDKGASHMFSSCRRCASRLLACKTSEEVETVLLEQFEPKQKENTADGGSSIVGMDELLTDYVYKAQLEDEPEQVQLLIDDLYERYRNGAFSYTYGYTNYSNVRRYLVHCLDVLTNVPDTEDTHPLPPPRSIDKAVGELFGAITLDNPS